MLQETNFLYKIQGWYMISYLIYILIFDAASDKKMKEIGQPFSGTSTK